MDNVTLKWLHVLSATILFGAGVGSAFHLCVGTWRLPAAQVAGITRLVVIADWVFTAPTAVLQPLSGWWLVQLAGYDPWSTWLVWSYGLYALAIASWLPVVVLQYRLRELAAFAARRNVALPPRYRRLFAAWVALGTIAFAAFLAIFHLMIAKPA
jgi:uncharacterized membrane protein